MRIKSISLDLCIGNKASLVWVGQDHFFHRLKFLELIVDQTPIPACFNDGFAWPFQTGKKLRKPSCAIAFDSSLAQLPPALIQRAQHAVLLVDIYSDVVHENSFLSSSSLRTEMLLSCYLTAYDRRILWPRLFLCPLSLAAVEGESFQSLVSKALTGDVVQLLNRVIGQLQASGGYVLSQMLNR